jgi:hypothetical protein
VRPVGLFVEVQHLRSWRRTKVSAVTFPFSRSLRFSRCINEADCLSRSTTDLGSSKNWPPIFSADGGPNGWLSSNPAVNPSFYKATKVFVGYCDGASFSGNIPA